MQDTQDITEIISRLRNRSVAQLLTDLGEQPPMIVRSIKRQFSRFASDLTQEIDSYEQNTKSKCN